MPLVVSPRESESAEIRFDRGWRAALSTPITVADVLRASHAAYPLQPLERVSLASGSWMQWPRVSSESLASMTMPSLYQQFDPWGEEETFALWEPIRLLGRFYVLRDELEVGEFIERHPFLLPLLLEARVWIKKYFPREEVALEVVVDPEEPDFEELFAFVITDLPPNQALERLDELDNEWWLGAMPRAQGKLCIDVEFR